MEQKIKNLKSKKKKKKAEKKTITKRLEVLEIEQ
jgi:hypothetical protein